uniref:[RNA-polymerase]-subunit kinase n=1 Tax=Oryza brachyantha TaxID=4533 RepID=J3N0Z3_ORYBR
MAAAVAMACKRPAPDGDACSAAAPCKKPRLLFTSIFNYERMETLGAGTYGVVYRARDRRTGETVAVKWLRDVAANPSNWDMFLVMEFVGTRSLRDLIVGRARRPFSEAETRALMRQLLAGVRTMHAAGMAHRDIKPGNILVGPGCALKICDFGMATTAAPPYERFMVGTLHYNAPEQLTGKGQYNAQAVDTWALGCVMAELLTGGPAFTSKTVEEHLLELSELRDYDVGSKDSLAFGGLPGLSPAGREVLAGLLAFCDDERMTAEAALEHRWFTED